MDWPNVKQFFLDMFEIFQVFCTSQGLDIFNPQIRRTSEDCITFKDIREKILNKEYEKDIWLFIEHCTKAFQYIEEASKPRSKIYKLAIECKQIFNEEVSEFMKRNGYCCGQYRVVQCKRISCSGSNNCVVKPNAGVYYWDTKTYCDKCFEKLPDDSIEVSDSVTVPKSKFKHFTYVEFQPEEMVICVKCHRKHHERCVIHSKLTNFPFICKTCRDSSLPMYFQQLNLSTDHIQTTEIDKYIEDYLHRNRPDCEGISIRMLGYSLDKFRPKSIIADRRSDLRQFPEIFFNNCAVFAFLKQADGSEVCFYSIYCQLYNDPRCPPANRNNAYLSYIDSTKLCDMKNRTEIYQTILFGLFEYLKSKHFRAVFIWSCPPTKGVDYVFYNKPQSMRIPTKNRLVTWYKNLLNRAQEKHIIKGYSTAKEYSRKHNWCQIDNVPYFYSDLWSLRIQEMLSEMNLMVENKELKNQDFNTYLEEWLQLQYDRDGKDYFIAVLGSRGLPIKTEMDHDYIGKWISQRTELLDMLQMARLNFSTERDAKFSTFLMLYRYYVEDGICRRCGNCELTMGFTLVCRRCTKEMLGEPELPSVTAPYEEDMDIDWPSLFDLVNSSGNDSRDCVVDLTVTEKRAYVPKIFTVIDLCDED